MRYLSSGKARTALTYIILDISWTNFYYRQMDTHHLIVWWTKIPQKAVLLLSLLHWIVYYKTQPAEHQVEKIKNGCLLLLECYTAGSCWLCWFH